MGGVDAIVLVSTNIPFSRRCLLSLQTVLPLNELIERRHSLLIFLAFLSIMRLSHYSFVPFLVDCNVSNSPSHFQHSFV